MLGVNSARQQVDIFFRLDPGARCPAHRHLGPTDTLVVEGEHRIHQRTDDVWVLTEVRAPGTFAANEGDQLHSEEGGSEGAIVHLSMMAIDGVIWEVLDEEGRVEAVTTLEDFQRALDHQNAVIEATLPA